MWFFFSAKTIPPLRGLQRRTLSFTIIGLCYNLLQNSIMSRFGLPPVPPASPRNPTPFGGTDVGITVTWSFNCGHSFTQENDHHSVYSSSFRSEANKQKHRFSSQKCPECIESEPTKQEKIRESLRAKEEAARKLEEERNAAAKALELDVQALEVYRSQASTIQQHIDNAGDNEEL